MQTIKAFAEKHGLTIQSVRVDSNPRKTDPKWEAAHFRVTVQNGQRGSITTYYSLGSGHRVKSRAGVGEFDAKRNCYMRYPDPELESVLDCLAIDASFAEGNTYNDFCAELGVDTDSRKALESYLACQQTAMDLHRLLGRAAYNELMNETERL
jgi:hypothetical protein